MSTPSALPLDVAEVCALSTVPGSDVLVAGVGDGAVVRALAARGCRVWAAGADRATVEAVAPLCADVAVADVDDLADRWPQLRVDAAVRLDAGGSADPAAALLRLAALVRPGGRVLLGLPGAASSGGEYDRDRALALVAAAGCRVVDVLAPSGGDAGRRVVVATPGGADDVPPATGLATALSAQVASLQARLTDLDAILRERSAELDDATTALRAAQAALAVKDAYIAEVDAVAPAPHPLRRGRPDGRELALRAFARLPRTAKAARWTYRRLPASVQLRIKG